MPVHPALIHNEVQSSDVYSNFEVSSAQQLANWVQTHGGSGADSEVWTPARPPPDMISLFQDSSAALNEIRQQHLPDLHNTTSPNGLDQFLQEYQGGSRSPYAAISPHTSAAADSHDLLRREPPTLLSENAEQCKKRHECRQAGCNKTFSRPYDRDRHEQIHFKQKQFLCGVQNCKHASPAGAFHRRDHLTQHIRRMKHVVAEAVDDLDVAANFKGKKRVFEANIVTAESEDSGRPCADEEEPASKLEIKRLRLEIEELKNEMRRLQRQEDRY